MISVITQIGLIPQIILGLIFIPLIILGIIKVIKISKVKARLGRLKMPKIKFSIGKSIWIGLIVLGVLNFAYPGDWFIARKIHWYFAPSYEKDYLAISKNQMEREIAEPEKNLAELVQTAKTRALTEKEKGQAEQWKKEIQGKERRYKSGNLTQEIKNPEWNYIFGWDATDKQMEATNRKQIPSKTYRAKIVKLTEDEMIFIYQTNKTKENISVKLKRRKEEIKGNQGLYYKGWIQNIDTKKSDPIWLTQTTTPNEFNGWIGKNFGAEVFLLSKK